MSKNANRLAKKATKWLSSPAGKAALTEAVRKSMETIERLRSAQRVDPKTLQEPVTI